MRVEDFEIYLNKKLTDGFYHKSRLSGLLMDIFIEVYEEDRLTEERLIQFIEEF